ncbi:unnamed protein product [Cyclocybe aegerita]|uniref:protein-ribulosamine 3-kinase n=1 Tax=Cyclocybe aegerita TaxID=1973307 RepID=A0A8S0VX98_CYCAE|nr:unnamed protein product [Cyclocybe aegerita]
MAIPQPILSKLQELEPDASFEGNLPRARSSSGSIYFAKVGIPREEEQYAGEAESLKAIGSAAPSLAPRVFCSGVTESGTPYFISEYKDISSLTSRAASVLAKRMATELHAKSSPTGKFGFAIPTYCGVTKLSNGWFDRWDECYTSMIGDLLDQLRRKGHFEHLCRKAERVKNEVIPKLLGPIDTQPVILHGDLWSGNAGVDTATGQPVIFDPASYYGHNEAE